MTDPVPPAPGLVRKEINGVEYWFDEEAKKVHSVVSRFVHAVAHSPVALAEHVEFVVAADAHAATAAVETVVEGVIATATTPAV